MAKFAWKEVTLFNDKDHGLRLLNLLDMTIIRPAGKFGAKYIFPQTDKPAAE